MEGAQAEAEYVVAQQDLIVRTAEAYFNVLAARDTLEAAQAAHDAIGRQLEQSEKRFEVGLIAVTDVQDAKSAFDSATAALIQGKRNLANAGELLRELTGDAWDMLEKPGQRHAARRPESGEPRGLGQARARPERAVDGEPARGRRHAPGHQHRARRPFPRDRLRRQSRAISRTTAASPTRAA